MLMAMALSSFTGHAQSFSTIKNFSGSASGANSYAGLTVASNVLYGTTYAAYGTVFKVNGDGSGYAVIKNFGTNGNDGAYPMAGLTLAGGTLYGTTRDGGNASRGNVFKVNPDGSGFAVLRNFTNGSPDGTSPLGRLVSAGDMLYGTDSSGGSSGGGTVFAIGTNGAGFKVLTNFSISLGVTPNAELILADGTLYGTTVAFGGGGSGSGMVFKINTNGTGFSVLKPFTNSLDGAKPYAGLVLAGDTLYGTTDSGGSAGYGTVFSLGTNGTGFTVLRSFTNSPDGANPRATLTLSGNVLYGTTRAGGSAGFGTVFAINTNGSSYAILKNFTNSPDGASPYAGLTLSGSVLYGTTYAGGNPSGYGTVFDLDLSPPLTIATNNGTLGFNNKQFQFVLTGPAGSNVVVTVSTNLQTWTPLLTNPLAGGTLTVTDALATNYLQRFYRAALSP